MIVSRRWQGRIRPEMQDAFISHLSTTSLPDFAVTPGNLGYLVEHRQENDYFLVVVTSFWESLDAIRAFAGDEYENAKVYSGDDRFICDKEMSIGHYVVEAALVGSLSENLCARSTVGTHR